MRTNIILFVLFSSSMCWAQVNVEPLRSRLDDSGFGAEFSGSLTVRGGNKQKLGFDGDVLAGVQIDPHLLYFNAALSYERHDGEVEEEESFVHTRYNLELTPWLWWELFAQRRTDRFRYVTRQDLLGSGLRVGYKGKSASAFYGSSYMPEFLITEESQTPQLFHRWNNYASGVMNYNTMIASVTVYYQPRFDRLKDYYLLVVPSLRFCINDILNSSIGGEVSYVSMPYPNEGALDYTIKNSLGVSF